VTTTAFTCPASFAQERFWFAHQVDPGDLSANLTWTFRIAGPLRVDQLRRALDTLVTRHEVLRTTFSTVDSRPVQVVRDAMSIPFDVEHSESDAWAWAEEAAEVAFDLARGPLVGARLLQKAVDLHYFQLRLHHIVADAWSVGLLLDELGTLYRGGTLAVPALQYADFATWQRDPRREPRFQDQLAFWTHRLTRSEPERLRRAHERSPGTVPVDLPGDVVDPLRKLAARHRATLYLVLLAAFCAAARLGRPRVGAPVADRPDPRLAAVAGPFVNTLVLDVDTTDDPAFSTLLARVKETFLDAEAHKDVPFERVVRQFGPGRREPAEPLVDMLFVLHTGGLPTLRLGELAVSRVATTPPPPPVGLVASLVTDGPAVRGRFDYLSDLDPPRSVDRLVADFRTVLEGAARHPDRPLSALLPPDDAGSSTVSGATAPRTTPTPAPAANPEIVRDLCAIWAEVLKIDEVAADDDFFDVGGYSLLAVQILALVEERFGVRLTIRQFFEHPTVAELSTLL
jgi:acyl carrier protein